MIKKIPPVEQDVFFQDCQFDPNIGEGADPEVFWRGRPRFGSGRRGRGFKRVSGEIQTMTIAAKFLRAAKNVLIGHKNEEEIMKVLKSGVKE